MDANLTFVNARITTSPEEIVINGNVTSKIVFVPIFLIQVAVTIISNAILLIMISRSLKSCTSLNIFLFSISVFNLITLVNQVSFVVYILQQEVTRFPLKLCHMMSIIKSSSTMGITLLHLFISHHRYKIAKNPLTWQNTRKQAWLLGVLIWAIALAVAIFECVLHFNNDSKTSWNLQTCLWPGLTECTTMLSLYVQVLTFVCLGSLSGITCYFYIKAAKELKDNELEKEYRLRSSTLVYNKHGKRKMTNPERAVVSLFTIFIIHCITQLPIYIYGIIVHSRALSIGDHTADVGDEQVTIVLYTSSTAPVLLLIVGISFITSGSPLVLACINRKFKEHIKSIVHYICGSEYQEHNRFLHQVTARFPEEAPPPVVDPLPPPPTIVRDFDMFYGSGNRSKVYLKGNYASSERQKQQHLQIPTADSLRPDRISLISLTPQRGGVTRPSRVSTTSESVGLAAVSAGLVLSAPGHRIMINNFFIPDENEAMMERLSTLNFV